MDCHSCQPLLAEFALGQLAGDEREEVARHLESGCRECRQALRETEEAWALLADALPPAEVPPHIQAVLRKRIAMHRPEAPATKAERPQSAVAFTPEQDEVAAGRGTSRRWLAVAAAVLVALTVGFVSWLTYIGRQWEAQEREMARQARGMQRLQSQLSEANELFHAGRLHFASLREAGPRSTVRGYVVWDRLSRQVHFYVFDLPPASEGRVWRIWLYGQEQEPVPAGTLAVQANGTASAVIDAPAELGDRFRLSVVEDPVEPPALPDREPWLTADME